MHTWLRLIRAIRVSLYFSVYFLKRNTDDPAPAHPSLPPSNKFPMLKQTKICLSENISRRHDFIIHATIQRSLKKLREAPSKERDHSDEESSPLRLESQTEVASQWWYHTTGPLRKRSDLSKKEHFIGDIPRNTPHTLLMLLATRKEFPSAKQQLLTRVRTPRHKRRWWNQIHLHDRPGLSPLLPQTHHQERRSSSTKMRTGLIRSEIRQTNYVKAEPYLSFLIAEFCCEN